MEKLTEEKRKEMDEVGSFRPLATRDIILGRYTNIAYFVGSTRRRLRDLIHARQRQYACAATAVLVNEECLATTSSTARMIEPYDSENFGAATPKIILLP